MPHLPEAVLIEWPASDVDALTRLASARRNERLREAITELPEVYQSALRLYYWLDTSVADIAVLLDVPENTVKSYLHRARKLLSGLLEQRGLSDD